MDLEPDLIFNEDDKMVHPRNCWGRDPLETGCLDDWINLLPQVALHFLRWRRPCAALLWDSSLRKWTQSTKRCFWFHSNNNHNKKCDFNKFARKFFIYKQIVCFAMKYNSWGPIGCTDIIGGKIDAQVSLWLKGHAKDQLRVGLFQPLI